MNEVEEFTLMQDFLSLFDSRVEPRDGEPLTDSHRKLLERIARGEATESERSSAIDILVKDAKALEFLAKQLLAN